MKANFIRPLTPPEYLAKCALELADAALELADAVDADEQALSEYVCFDEAAKSYRRAKALLMASENEPIPGDVYCQQCGQHFDPDTEMCALHPGDLGDLEPPNAETNTPKSP